MSPATSTAAPSRPAPSRVLELPMCASVSWLCSLAGVSVAEMQAGSPPLAGAGLFCGLCWGRAKRHIPGLRFHPRPHTRTRGELASACPRPASSHCARPSVRLPPRGTGTILCKIAFVRDAGFCARRRPVRVFVGVAAVSKQKAPFFPASRGSWCELNTTCLQPLFCGT